MNGRVTLVGAGCGDYDLMTLRALDALKKCDVVIYDALIDTRILEGLSAEKICVGKRSGSHSARQEDINALLIQKARDGNNIVRLKGGDPFVFGRGGEEITALSESGIPYSIIPGISSCIAAPELAGIPVTHRKTARGFHVITAHTADDCADFSRYAALDGTLIFLMGFAKIAEISTGLISGGMSENTPSAVISNGGSHAQKTVRAPLSQIAAAVRNSGISAPAVIVVGEVAQLDFSPTYTPPLGGISAAVISTSETANKLCEGLHRLGAFAYRVGGVEIHELRNAEIDAAFSTISSRGIIALSSPNGARIFLRKLREKHIDLRDLHGVKLAVIGSGTAKVLENAGIFPEIMPEQFTARALGEEISRRADTSGKTLILRSTEGSPELTSPLAERGCDFDDVRIYEPIYLNASLVTADYALFTSAGAVRGFFANGGAISDNTRPAAIGSITKKELERHGVFDAVLPENSAAEQLIDAIIKDVEMTRK